MHDYYHNYCYPIWISTKLPGVEIGEGNYLVHVYNYGHFCQQAQQVYAMCKVEE